MQILNIMRYDKRIYLQQSTTRLTKVFNVNNQKQMASIRVGRIDDEYIYKLLAQICE